MCKFGTYHERWSALTKNDFQVDYSSSVCKGSYPLFEHAQRSMPPEQRLEDISYDNMSRGYLVKMIELCQSQNIEMLLINTGYDAMLESQLFADSIPELAAEYGLNYIDFTMLDVIDFDTDLQTGGHNTHVNVSGANKLTSYLGSYLTENYNLPDRREDESYNDWKENYDVYIDYKVSRLDEIESLPVELLALSDDDYNVILYINEKSQFLYENSNLKFIRNISKYQELDLQTSFGNVIYVNDGQNKKRIIYR